MMASSCPGIESMDVCKENGTFSFIFQCCVEVLWTDQR